MFSLKKMLKGVWGDIKENKENIIAVGIGVLFVVFIFYSVMIGIDIYIEVILFTFIFFSIIYGIVYGLYKLYNYLKSKGMK